MMRKEGTLHTCTLRNGQGTTFGVEGEGCSLSLIECGRYTVVSRGFVHSSVSSWYSEG